MTRRAQDEFALRSHQLAHRAWEDGFYDEWVVPVPGRRAARDESIRPDTTLEKLERLKPAFTAGGTVTAGNASPLNDGAGALLIGDGSLPEEPLARIVSRGVHAVDPDIFGIAPVEAANRALRRAGIGWDQVEVVELNEAFAAQSRRLPARLARARSRAAEPERRRDRHRAPARRLGGADPRRSRLRAPPARRRYGVAAICIGVGQGLAVVLEA